MNPRAGVCGVLAILALCGMSAGQDPSPEDMAQAKEFEDLQGTWQLIKGPGSPASDGRAKQITYVVKGHKMTVIDANPDQNSKIEGTIRLDPKSKAFDWTNPIMGWTGIYDRQGDTFRFYAVPKLTGATVKRPKSIEEKGGHLFLLKR